MIKIKLLALVLLSLVAYPSLAQQGSGMPVVTLTGLPTQKMTDGEVITAKTTRDYISKNPRLVIEPANCKILDYELSITREGKTWGPAKVTGADLTDEIIKKIKETTGPGVTVSVENIRVNNSGF